MSLEKLFKLYVKNTSAKSLVVEKTIFLCNLTNAVRKACGLPSSKTQINTKILKHLYDSKPAEEFDFLIKNIKVIAKYPDKVYKNMHSKKGDFCLVKKIQDREYLASLQTLKEINSDGVLEDINYIVTCFRVRDEKYLKNYELLWSWKGGKPSS